MTGGVRSAVVAQHLLGGQREERIVFEIACGLTAALLLRGEEIAEFIGLRDRKLGEDRDVLVDVIAETAERRGVAGIAIDRFIFDSGAIAADCDGGLARGDGAQIGGREYAGLSKLVAVECAVAAGNKAAERRNRLAAVLNIG